MVHVERISRLRLQARCLHQWKYAMGYHRLARTRLQRWWRRQLIARRRAAALQALLSNKHQRLERYRWLQWRSFVASHRLIDSRLEKHARILALHRCYVRW